MKHFEFIAPSLLGFQLRAQRASLTKKARIGVAAQLQAVAFIVVVGAISSAPLAAQSTIPPNFPDPATCSIKAGIQSFVLEEVIGPTAFGSIFNASFPPEAIAAFSDPTKEPRIHVTFDTATMINKAWVIAVPKGSPAITPATTNFDAISVATSVAQITKVFTVCYPRPSILIAGPLSYSALIFGPQVGVPHGMGFSIDPANSSNVNNADNVTVFDAGTSTVFTNLASAIVVPAVVSSIIAGTPTVNAMYRHMVLDGTGSATASGPMTYSWSTNPGVNIGILDPTSPQTRILIGGPPGDYPVTLTVTTAFAKASSTVTVHFAPDLE